MNKIRAGDGMLIAGEKRLVIHFMLQPNFVSELLGDPVLREQGFLSRLLIAWPKSRIGFRINESDDDREPIASPGEEEFRRRIHALVSRYGSDELELAAPLQADLEARKFGCPIAMKSKLRRRPALSMPIFRRRQEKAPRWRAGLPEF